MKVLAIDPGTNKSGVVVLENRGGQTKVVDWAWIKAKGDDPFDRCLLMASQILGFYNKHNPFFAVCEYPHKGGIGMQTKRITILYHLCGTLHGKIPYLRFIPVVKWKGNLPKAVVQTRLARKYDNLDKYPEDVIDAIGLGDYFIKQNELAINEV